MNLKLRQGLVGLALITLWAGLSAVVAADQVAVTVKVKSFNSLAADIDTVAAALQIGRPGMVMGDTLAMAIDQQLGTTGMDGIDRDAPFYLFVLVPDSGVKMTPSIVGVIPVTDQGQAVLKGIGNSYAVTNLSKGVHQFSSAMKGGAGKNGEMSVSVVGKSLVFSPRQEGVVLVAERVGKGKLGLNAPAVPGTIQIAVDLPVVMPLMESSFSGMSSALKQAQGVQSTPTTGPNPAQILDVEAQWLLRLSRQMKSLSFSLSADAQAIRIASDMVAQPNSKLESMNRHLKPVSSRYTSLLPADSLFAFASGGMTVWDDMADVYVRFMEQVMSAMGSEGINGFAAMRETLSATKGLYAGDAAAGVYYRDGQKGLSFVQYVAVKDAAKARQYIVDSVIHEASSFSNLMAGVKLSLGPQRTYKGTEITSVRYVLDSPDRAAGAQAAMPLPSFLQRFRDFTVEYAIVSNTLITAAFSPSAMDLALDHFNDGGTALNQSPMFKALCPDAQSAPESLYSLRLVSLMKALISRMGSVDPAMLASIPESSSGMAGYSYLQGSEVISINSLGMSEVLALRQAGTLMMSLMMQGAMQPAGR